MNIMTARRVFRKFMSGPLWPFDSLRSLRAGAFDSLRSLRAPPGDWSTSSYINILARSFGRRFEPHRRVILPPPQVQPLDSAVL
jgi:hypothetical protein